MSSSSKQPADPNTDLHLHQIFSGWLGYLPPAGDVEEPVGSVDESEQIEDADAVPRRGRNLQIRISSADTKASRAKGTGKGGRREGSGRKPAGTQLFKQFVADSEAEAAAQELEMGLEERKAARAYRGRQARNELAMQKSTSDTVARKDQSGASYGVLSLAIPHQRARQDAVYCMTPVQMQMLHLAEETRNSKQGGDYDEESRPQTWRKLLTTKIPVASRQAMADTLGEATSTLRRRTAQAAAAVINGTGVFTAALTNWLRSCQESETHRLVLLLKKRRYDETPSKIAIETQGAQGETASKESATAKIMQSEFSLRFLWQDLRSGSYHSYCMQIPTWLQVMDRTTAEVTKATQLEIESAVADLERLSHMYEMNVSLINTDRYASNMKAERSIAQEQPTFVSAHYGCDAHAAARVVSHQFKKIDSHISGMIAGALAMQEAGSTKVFQECISQILEDRLVLQYGTPSEECMRHTIAVLNLFLPTPNNIHTASKGTTPSLQRLQKQRAILLFFLNGDITDETQVQFYTASWNPDRHRVLNAMHAFLVPALCPCKPRLLSRKSWTGGDHVISYFGILCSFHNIFTPAVQLYTNMTAKPEVPLVHPVTLQAALGEAVPEEPGPAPMALEDAVVAGEQNPDNTGTGTEAFATGNMDWSQINRNMKRRFSAWAECKPRDILIVAKLSTLCLGDFTFLLPSFLTDRTGEIDRQAKVVDSLDAFLMDHGHVHFSGCQSQRRGEVRNSDMLRNPSPPSIRTSHGQGQANLPIANMTFDTCKTNRRPYAINRFKTMYIYIHLSLVIVDSL